MTILFKRLVFIIESAEFEFKFILGFSYFACVFEIYFILVIKGAE